MVHRTSVRPRTTDVKPPETLLKVLLEYYCFSGFTGTMFESPKVLYDGCSNEEEKLKYENWTGFNNLEHFFNLLARVHYTGFWHYFEHPTDPELNVKQFAFAKAFIFHNILRYGERWF